MNARSRQSRHSGAENARRITRGCGEADAALVRHGGHAPLHTRKPFGQSTTLPEHLSMVQANPGSHRAMHTPEPGQSMVQSPLQSTSQPPEPVQDMLLACPTDTRHGPEPVQLAMQASPQMKSHPPEPAHCRLHASRQWILQSPVPGQTQSAPLHSNSPPKSGGGPSSPSQPATEPAKNVTRKAFQQFEMVMTCISLHSGW
jgi:hypothetical protein